MYVPNSKATLFLISFHIFSFDGAFINLLRVSLNTYYTLLSVYFEKHQKFQIFHMSFFSLQSPLVRRPFVWPTWIYACGAIWGLLYIYANPENKWYSTLRRCEGENDMNISISLSRLFRAILLKKSNSHYRFDLDDRPWKTSDMLSTKCYANLTLFFPSLSCSDLSKDWL